MIKSEIIKDSIAPSGIRLTTFSLTYPRFIHSELMTHRMFSRNSSSSRAIPFKKQLEYLKQNIAYPEYFMYNKKGMQASEKFTQEDENKARAIWYMAAENMIKTAENLGLSKEEGGLNAHKQYVNRLLEPFLHINVVVTSTNYSNFFGLRYHQDAQPEIFELAKQMYSLYNTNQPNKLEEGEWHLPYTWEADDILTHEQRIKKSVAGCARVSYKTIDGKDPSIEDCERIYDKLITSEPLHASPAEHQAMATGDPNVVSGNFKGWIQYRKTLKNEFIEN
jgi:thymidylate synthase ThyX